MTINLYDKLSEGRKRLHVSQTFYSVQGEGPRTGVLSVWLRTFGCPLKCQGFFQKEPTNPSSYVNPLTFAPKSITRLRDFPVVEYGCDTLYAIDPKFKHLRRTMEIDAVREELMAYLPGMEWQHPKTNNSIDLCITGGEPLLQQSALADLIYEINSYPSLTQPTIQFETNATQRLKKDLSDALDLINRDSYFNVSPKLFNVSGENYEWSGANISEYLDHAKVALKIVVNSSDAAWFELDEKVAKLKADLGNYLPPVYIMPVGATFEQQSDQKEIEKISNRALENGYHISGRLHCILWGNDIDA